VNLSSYAAQAVRLANTAACASDEPDPLGSPSACAGALGDSLAGPVTRHDLDVLRHVRAEFNAIFSAAAASDHQAAMDRLNALLVQFPIQPEMTNHDQSRWHFHLAPQGSVGDRFAAGAIIGVSATVAALGVSRLGVCAIASCPRVFIDASPNQSRRYCGMHAAARGNVSALHIHPAGIARRVSRDGSTAKDATPGRATPAAS
jgi:predicted RNA-binding Zn ribbon-like protein